MNYKTDDLDAAIDKFGAIDVWFETRREQDFDQAVEHLALDGRMIVMAGREARPKFPVGPFYTKDCKLLGFAMFNAPADEQRKCAAEINRWLGQGKAPAADRPRDEALRDRCRPPPPGRKHAPQSRHAGRQDRAGAVRRATADWGLDIRD